MGIGEGEGEGEGEGKGRGEGEYSDISHSHHPQLSATDNLPHRKEQSYCTGKTRGRGRPPEGGKEGSKKHYFILQLH